MNERIRELAEQAKFMAEEDINKQISYNTELKAFAEKFAELLIQECGRVADVFCHIWCDEDKPHDVTVGNYIKRQVLRADPE
jgi:hypothetical protein